MFLKNNLKLMIFKNIVFIKKFIRLHLRLLTNISLFIIFINKEEKLINQNALYKTKFILKILLENNNKKF